MFKTNYFEISADSNTFRVFHIPSEIDTKSFSLSIRDDPNYLSTFLSDEYLGFRAGLYFTPKNSFHHDVFHQEFEDLLRKKAEFHDIPNIDKLKGAVMLIEIPSTSFIAAKLIKNALIGSSLKDKPAEENSFWAHKSGTTKFCFIEDYKSKYSGTSINKALDLIEKSEYASRFLKLLTCLKIGVQHDFDKESSVDHIYLVLEPSYESRANLSLNYLMNIGILDSEKFENLVSSYVNYKKDDKSDTKIGIVVKADGNRLELGINFDYTSESINITYPLKSDFPLISLNRTFSTSRKFIDENLWSNFSIFESLKNKENKIPPSEVFSRLTSLVKERLMPEIGTFKISGSNLRLNETHLSLIDNYEGDDL